MKNLEIDRQVALVGPTEVKDKRTLVLFLLGLTLLCVDLMPFTREPAGSSYEVVVEDHAQQWSMQRRRLPVAATGPLEEETAQEPPPRVPHHRLVPLVSEQGPGNALPAEVTVFANQPFPINRASQGALEMLPGVGPHLAAAIINEQQQGGKFNSPNDLLRVPGIGPKKLQRLLPLISFE